MNNKKETYESHLERAISHAVHSAETERYETITRSVYHLIKQDPDGSVIISIDKVERESGTGWSPRDVRNMFYPMFVGEDASCKAEQHFKGIQPTMEELAFVMSKMAKLGVLTVAHHVCKDRRFGQPIERDETTYKFNQDFKGFQSLVVTGDLKKEPATPKRRRPE